MKTIVIAGGRGFLGRVLTAYFEKQDYRVIILSRGKTTENRDNRSISWDGETPGPWVNCLEGAEALINLSGKSVNCRYTPANREAILRSRLDSTSVLCRAMKELKVPPKTWINMASATIYRHAEDRPMDEHTGEYGEGFSVDVCRAWEGLFSACALPGTRKVIIRTSIVIGRDDGAFTRMRNLARAGLGGRQGSGRQMVSWIHEHDFARAIDWLITHPGQEGVFNIAAPGPVSNATFMQVLRKELGMPFGLRTPAWLLEQGARLIGTETELILKSRWVIPGRLTSSGFTFVYPEIQSAIAELISRRA